MCGSVASPTPTMPISLDSMRWTRTWARKTEAKAGAVIQPAAPPPTITSFNGSRTSTHQKRKRARRRLYGAPDLYRTLLLLDSIANAEVEAAVVDEPGTRQQH